MFEKIVNKSFLIKVLYFLCIISTFCIVSRTLAYSIIVYDDILDLVINKLTFYHGRFFSEFLAFLLVKGIPEVLNINIQDFALVSQNLVKALIFIWLSILVTNAFFFFKSKEKTLSNVFVYIFTFFFLWIILQKENGFVLDTLQFYFGYILPLPVFLITWYKLGEIYINEKVPSAVEIKLLVLLALLIAQFNEMVDIILFLLLAFLGCERLLQYYKHKSTKNYKWILHPFVALVLMSEIVYTHSGFIEIYNNYKSPEPLFVKFQGLVQYLQIFADKLFVENILVIIPTVVLFVAVINSNKNKEENKKVIKYLTYTWLSVFMFFFALFLVGKSCHYYYVAGEKSYWILYAPFLYSYKLFLYTFGLFLLGYFVKNDDRIELKLIILLFFFIGFFVNIQCSFNVLKYENHAYNRRKIMYLLDKLSVFYFLRGETAILPKDGIERIYTIEKNNEVMPYDLISGEYKNKIYYKDSDNNLWPYLKYIEDTYEIDNIEKGIMFVPNKDAIKEYKKRGGTFTKGELNELDFEEIEEQVEAYEENNHQ